MALPQKAMWCCNSVEGEVPVIAEVIADKFGSYTPGTNIPIVSEAEARAMKPDYFLVLPFVPSQSLSRQAPVSKLSRTRLSSASAISIANSSNPSFRRQPKISCAFLALPTRMSTSAGR
jgi:hypothetical protein